MSRSNPFKTVIAGEASESDDEETQPKSATAGIVISGEASESEEEDEPRKEELVIQNTTDNLPRLKVEKPEEAANVMKSAKVVTKKAKHDSLLHRKLRERNSALHAHLVDLLGSLYVASGKDVKTIATHLAKSQSAIQETSHTLRLLTNDLFYLEDKVDIVSSCTILPDINIAPLPSSSPGRGSSVR